MTNDTTPAATAIIGLMGLILIALGLTVTLMGYGISGANLEWTRTIDPKLIEHRSIGLLTLWHPTLISGGAIALLGCIFVGSRARIAAKWVGPTAPANVNLNEVFLAMITAVGLLLVATSAGLLALFAASRAFDSYAEPWDGIVFASVALLFGCLFALRPRWVVRAAGNGTLA